MNVISEHMPSTAMQQQAWGSERTVLRTEQVVTQIEMLLLRDHLPEAHTISMRWDLSPQGNKELLATFITVCWTTQNLPDIYDADSKVSGSADVHTFNFALPLVQCPSKEGHIVAEKLKQQLALLGLQPADLTADGPVYITSDGGSENKPAMRKLFGEGNFVDVYCGAHALSLVFTHAVDVLPGSRAATTKQRSTKMTHWWVAAAEKVVNLIRNNWQNFETYAQELSKWPDADKKPPRAVRTRWLSAVDTFR